MYRGPRPAALTPGRALSVRHTLELELQRDRARMLNAFLRDVRTMARQRPEEVSLQAIDGLWESHAQAAMAALRTRMRRDFGEAGIQAGRLGARLVSMESSLQVSVIPVDVLGTVQDVLGLPPRQRARALATALRADTGTAKVGGEPGALGGHTWRTKMERAARTDATDLFSSAVLDDLAVQGFTMKRWVAHHDQHTRPTHLAADGQTAPLWEHFTVGGALMEAPGDLSGPPSERENCRCTVVGVA